MIRIAALNCRQLSSAFGTSTPDHWSYQRDAEKRCLSCEWACWVIKVFTPCRKYWKNTALSHKYEQWFLSTLELNQFFSCCWSWLIDFALPTYEIAIWWQTCFLLGRGFACKEDTTSIMDTWQIEMKCASQPVFQHKLLEPRETCLTAQLCDKAHDSEGNESPRNSRWSGQEAWVVHSELSGSLPRHAKIT